MARGAVKFLKAADNGRSDDIEEDSSTRRPMIGIVTIFAAFYTRLAASVRPSGGTHPE